MKRIVHKSVILCGALLMTMAQGARAIEISQYPLFLSAGATPNVMLLVDNSGSMNNIIWADDYDPTFDYPNWSNGEWSSSSGNVHYDDLPVGDSPCSSGWSAW